MVFISASPVDTGDATVERRRYPATVAEGTEVAQLIRVVGFLVCAAAAAAVMVLLAPKAPTSTPTLPNATQYESLIGAALDAEEVNLKNAESAPQQTVAELWAVRDLLTIIAKENADILKAQGAVVDVTGTLQTAPFDERVPALLVVGIATLCWAGITTPRAGVVVAVPAVAT